MQSEHARSEVLAALEAVDLVVLFDEDTPIQLITQIRPNVLVKGADYTREQVVGHEVVEAGGGEVRLVEILPGFSTTSLVDRARGGREVNVGGDDASGRSGAAGVARSAGLGQGGGYCRGADCAVAAMVDVAGRHLHRGVADRSGADARPGAFLASLKRPICALPIALFALAVVGTLWSDAPWGARLYAIGPTAKLLVLPVLLYHYQRSTRGLWVLTAFLISCALLMVMSWIVAFDPGLSLKSKLEAERGIFVKNYIDQSQEFALCAVALAYPVVTLLRARQACSGIVAGRRWRSASPST